VKTIGGGPAARNRSISADISGDAAPPRQGVIVDREVGPDAVEMEPFGVHHVPIDRRHGKHVDVAAPDPGGKNSRPQALA
jgi:hypothetical protein